MVDHLNNEKETWKQVKSKAVLPAVREESHMAAFYHRETEKQLKSNADHLHSVPAKWMLDDLGQQEERHQQLWLKSGCNTVHDVSHQEHLLLKPEADPLSVDESKVIVDCLVDQHDEPKPGSLQIIERPEEAVSSTVTSTKR
jgi:hypothetical protein